jgi:hypothetical protein
VDDAVIVEVRQPQRRLPDDFAGLRHRQRAAPPYQLVQAVVQPSRHHILPVFLCLANELSELLQLLFVLSENVFKLFDFLGQLGCFFLKQFSSLVVDIHFLPPMQDAGEHGQTECRPRRIVCLLALRKGANFSHPSTLPCVCPPSISPSIS